ncbi:MAG: co-chaperone GroES [Acholeplasmataceae bacterium]|jgi:chaperonin GroES|nr:co-chaperone GroES [Acholeplasmataceae bacterium]
MIKPLKNNVILEIKKEETKTESGIILTTESKTKSQFGCVLEVGPEVTSLSKGDEVVYKNYSGTTVEIKGVEYMIIKEEDILAIVK